MSQPGGESKVAVVASVIGNLIIAVLKFVAGALTKSSAMIAEGIHSLVDTGNGILVLVGLRNSEKPADDQHPFGYGKELYFWSLIVAVSVFGIGGGMSVYEGITHIEHPAPLENPLYNYIVLAISFAVEGASFFVAMREFGKAKGSMSALRFVRVAKDPSLFTVVFEDSAAMIGLVFAFAGVFLGHLYNNPYLDGAASIAIGLVLMGVAIALAAETKALLLGEGVEPEVLERMRSIAAGDPDCVKVGAIRSAYFGPADLLVTMDIALRQELDTRGVQDAIVRVESAVRAAYPEATRVYIEVGAAELL